MLDAILIFFKNPNDDKVSSARFLKNNAYTTRIHQEKKLYTQLPGPSKIHQKIPAGLLHVYKFR